MKLDERSMNLEDSTVLFKLSVFRTPVDDNPLLSSMTSYKKDCDFQEGAIYQNYYAFSSSLFL